MHEDICIAHPTTGACSSQTRGLHEAFGVQSAAPTWAICLLRDVVWSWLHEQRSGACWTVFFFVVVVALFAVANAAVVESLHSDEG